MAAYCTIADLSSHWGQADLVRLTNPGNQLAQQIDETRLNAEIKNQSDVIDSFVGMSYDLPLPLTPRPLVDCCMALVIHGLDNKRTREDVRQRYEDWFKWLEKVAAGKVSLGIQTTDPQPTPAGIDLVIDPPADKFTEQYYDF
jgi:phage gp36-like protein